MIPKIIFRNITLDEVVDILSWSVFCSCGPLSLSEATYNLYPELKAKVNTEMSDSEYSNIHNIIKELINRKYNKYMLENKNIPDKYTKVWNQYNDNFMIKLSEYLEIKWPKSMTNINVNIGPIPTCPRYLEKSSFTVHYKEPKELVKTCMHECCHFLFFEKCKKIFPNWKWEDFYNPSLLWYLSEIVVDSILNSDIMQTVFNYKFKCYNSFYKVMINDINLVEHIRKIFENKDIISAIKQSYDFMLKHENTIREQCNDNTTI